MNSLEMIQARKLEATRSAADVSHHITKPANWHELQRAIQPIAAEIVRVHNRSAAGIIRAEPETTSAS
jgi:hypothetical protein